MAFQILDTVHIAPGLHGNLLKRCGLLNIKQRELIYWMETDYDKNITRSLDEVLEVGLFG